MTAIDILDAIDLLVRVLVLWALLALIIWSPFLVGGLIAAYRENREVERLSKHRPVADQPRHVRRVGGHR